MTIDPRRHSSWKAAPPVAAISIASRTGQKRRWPMSNGAAGVVTITHTGTPPQHRGQGVAAASSQAPSTDFRAAGHKVVPACWFAREQFDAHPEWSDLLAAGLRQKWLTASDLAIEREENGSHGAYRAIVEGHTAEMTFSRTGEHLIIIDHTAVPDALRGRGVGQALVARAVADAREGGFKIFPLCPFAAAQFRRHQRVWGRAFPVKAASGGDGGEPIRIAMWSGPRNLSTALMRSFGNRPDCAVIDEPFYACFLQLSGRRASDARGNPSPPRDGLAEGRRGHQRRAAGRQAHLLPEAHDAPHAAGDRARLDARLPARLPDPPPCPRARVLCRQARGGRVRRYRLCRAGGALRRGGRDSPGRRRRLSTPTCFLRIRSECCHAYARRSPFPSAREC